MPKARPYSPTQRAAEGAVLHVLDRHAKRTKGKFPPLIAADGTPVTLKMMGSDSPAARRLRYATSAEQMNVSITRLRAGESESGQTPDDVALDEHRAIEKCARLLIAWTGVTEDDGSVSPCTYANAMVLFTDDDDLRQQALDFVEDRALFFAQCSTPSVDTASTSFD